MIEMPEYHFHYDWYTRNRWRLEKWWGISEKVNFLEIGAHEGRSTVDFAENFLSHPRSRLITIDPYFDNGDNVNDETMKRMLHNISICPNAEKITFHRMTSQDVFLRSTLLHGQTFDFIFVDGSHRSRDVILDLVNSWYHLKPGGVMICDDYMGGSEEQRKNRDPEIPKPALDSFLHLFQGEYDILDNHYWLIVRKKE